MINPRFETPSYRICPRCGRIMTRETRSDLNDEVICVVCVEKEMEEKNEANTNS